jgi:plastocyanin
MSNVRFSEGLLWAILWAAMAATACAQDQPSPASATELRLRIDLPLARRAHAVPAVIWLDPLPGTASLPFVAQEHYTLLQKNRMFTPHLQVVPVGSIVQFPNADPFFHNVFSLFDGKRFDLGLYEAGSSKSVTFSREGVSYIFCNIHPEMSAVIVTLSTPLYAIADGTESFDLRNVPPGNYTLHIWMEGVPQPILNSLDRRLHLAARVEDLGEIKAPIAGIRSRARTNEFGQAYPPQTQSTY